MPQARGEREQLLRVIPALESHVRERATDYYLLINVFVPPWNLDAIFVAPRGIAAVEFKVVGFPIYLRANGPGYLIQPDGSRQIWLDPRRSPFHQACDYRSALYTHVLENRSRILLPQKLQALDERPPRIDLGRQLRAFLVIGPRLLPGSDINVGEVPYFRAVDEPELAYRLDDELAAGVELTTGEIGGFLDKLNVRELSRTEAGIPGVAATAATIGTGEATAVLGEREQGEAASSAPAVDSATEPQSRPRFPRSSAIAIGSSGPNRPQPGAAASRRSVLTTPAASRWSRLGWTALLAVAAVAVLAGVLRLAVGAGPVPASPAAMSATATVAVGIRESPSPSASPRTSTAPATPRTTERAATQTYGPVATIRPGVTLAITELEPAAPYTSNLRATFKMTNSGPGDFWPRFDPSEITMTEDTGRIHRFQFVYWPPGEGPPGPMPPGSIAVFRVDFESGGLSTTTSKVEITFGTISGLTGPTVGWAIP